MSFDYLLKPLPTQSDLLRLRQECKELKETIDKFIAGECSLAEFKFAKQRLDSLSKLAKEAGKRLAKHEAKYRMRVVK